MIDRFIAFLRSQVGYSLYVWGAQGETDITEAWIRKRESNNETQVKRVLALWNKLKAQGISPIAAYDCSGLIVYWLLENQLIKGDMSSRGLYSACTPISRGELEKGDLVFHHNGTQINHVGVYVGGNKVIECVGRDYGVVERDINAPGASYWNRCGRFMPLVNAKSPEKAPGSDAVPDSDPAEPNQGARELCLMSPYMRGDDVLNLQKMLFSMSYNTGGLDGVFGPKTNASLRLFYQRTRSLREGVCDAAMRLLLGL